MRLANFGLILIFTLALFGRTAQNVHAEHPSTYWIDTEPENDEYTASRKFSRGLVNIGLGWTEIFYQPKYLAEVESYRWPAAVFGGVARGLGFTLVRLVSGIYDVVTFPIPLPKGYAPLVKPDFPMDPRPKANYYE